MKFKREDKFYVYIVECGDSSYYIGYTNNLENRFKLHNKGIGAKCLRGKLPIKLVYVKEYKYYKMALKKEIALKKLTHKQKEELIKTYNRKMSL